ncbi:hypothetical protein C0J52_18167 [Blattella germanica]|nr:hypothetical protein C0J52_18167 [Blattella germanica]
MNTLIEVLYDNIWTVNECGLRKITLHSNSAQRQLSYLYSYYVEESQGNLYPENNLN